MKVWGAVDPRYLNRKHLLGEHNELHTLLKVGSNGKLGGSWAKHSESVYNRFGGDPSLVIMRHELVRIAMHVRWPDNGHLHNHATPVDVTLLNADQLDFLEVYEFLALDGKDVGTDKGQIYWRTSMELLGFPPTTTHVYNRPYDTPWERDQMSFEEYLELGDNWSREIHGHPKD